MDVNILDRNVGITSGQREHIDRCLQFAFDRFGSHIRGIEISLTDVNGPKGGDAGDSHRAPGNGRSRARTGTNEPGPSFHNGPRRKRCHVRRQTSDVTSPLDLEEPDDLPPSTLSTVFERTKQ